MKKIFRFDFLTLFLSLVFGFGWSFLGGLLYDRMLGKLWTPLLIAIYFLGLSFFLFFAVLISNAIGNNAKPHAEQYKRSAIVMVALFFCSMLFEVIYEIQPAQFNLGEPTSYIFLIDDSGSMSGNDPQFIRNDAIYDVMKTCESDFPFAVYRFTDTCEQILPLTLAQDAQRRDYGFESSGTTEIPSAILTVLYDIKNGYLQAGKNPRILLLSDGESFFGEYNSVIRECLANNVSVSAVGFGEADRELLQRLARDTRGAFVWADSITNLTEAMNTAATTFSLGTRDLIGYRPFTEHDLLFAVLRCVFLLIVAAGFVLMKVFIFSTFDEKNVTLTIIIFCSALGALAPEVLINTLNHAPGGARTLMCVALSLLLGSSKKPEVQMCSSTFAEQKFGNFPDSNFANVSGKRTF